MELLELPGWQIEFDRVATAGAHAKAGAGGADECTCDCCKNWVQTRERIVPQAMQALLVQLGIPLNRDAEVYHIVREESGLHLYGGWYHFVGRVLGGQKQVSPDLVFGSFSAYFTTNGPLQPAPFAGLKVATLEFHGTVPWLSDLPECQ